MTGLTKTAQALDAEVTQVLASISKSWVRLGVLCSRMRDERLYEALGYERFDQWMELRLEQSRSTVYAAMRIVDMLSERLPEEEIAQLTKENAETLTKLPESQRYDPATMAAAKTMPAREFREQVEAGLTPLERSEKKRFLSFLCEESQASVIEAAVETAKKEAGTEQRSVALEMICAEFLSGHGVEMEWSNERAEAAGA